METKELEEIIFEARKYLKSPSEITTQYLEIMVSASHAFGSKSYIVTFEKEYIKGLAVGWKFKELD